MFPGVGDSCDIGLDTVIDNEVDWAEWVNFFWVSSESDHGVSHGSQVNDSWNTSKILQDDSCGLERDFDLFFGLLFPVEDVFDIAGLDFELIAISDGAFEENSDTVRESFESGVAECREVVVSEFLSSSLKGLGNSLERIGFGLREGQFSGESESVHDMKSTNNITLMGLK